MKVTVTGASGFIGSHLVRHLLEAGYEVRAMVRASSDLRNLEGAADLVYGDLRDPASLKAAFNGSRLVFHVAGVYTYWGVDPTALVAEARTGMQHVLDAARQANVERVIVTSSSVTLGASHRPVVLREEQTGSLADAPAYVKAKVAQEEAAFAKRSADTPEVVAVLPTITVGGPDYGPTESNRLIVSYLKDPWRSSWLGGCNIVSVDDVCRAHLLAAEQGQPGRRYLAGGENLEWTDFHRLVSELCGVKGPHLTAYHTSAYLAAAFYETISYFTGETPTSSREQARMVGKYYWYDHQRLAAIGYRPVSARQALTAALSWLVTSEHIPASLRAELKLSPEVFAYRKGGVNR